MPNTASVYARIDPNLKSDVDAILETLGVTPSCLIQMLYSQIRLTKGIPFQVKIPTSFPISIEELSREQLDSELQKGIDSINAGKIYSADEIDSILNKEFNI